MEPSDYGITWTNIRDRYDTEREECAAIERFVLHNQLPSYLTFCALLARRHAGPEYQHYARSLAERGGVPPCEGTPTEIEYILMKLLYDHVTDKDMVRCIGTRIYNRGGMELMRKCFYLLCNDSPLMFSRFTKSFATLVQYYWNGIGEWQA